MFLLIRLACSRFDDETILNLTHGKIFTHLFTPNHSNFTKQISISYNSEMYTHTAIKIDCTSYKGTITFVTSNNKDKIIKFDNESTYIGENQKIKSLIINIEDKKDNPITITAVCFNSKRENMKTVFCTKSDDIFSITSNSRSKQTVFNYVNFENTKIKIKHHSNHKYSSIISYITKQSEIITSELKDNIEINDSKSFSLSFSCDRRFHLTIETGNAQLSKSRIIITKNSSKFGNRKILSDFITGEIILFLFMFNFYFLLPIVMILSCIFPHRLYRIGLRWGCCYCCCTKYYPLFGRFYSGRNYKCYWGTCCGFCTHGSCTCSEGCCSYSNCPDAHGTKCCIFMEFCWLILLFTFLSYTLFFNCYMVINLCMNCDNDEKEFHRRYKTETLNPELNQSLMDQNTGKVKDPETPSMNQTPAVPEGIIGHHQHSNQMNEQRFIYEPQPPMNANQTNEQKSTYEPQPPTYSKQINEQRFTYDAPLPNPHYAPPPDLQQNDQTQQVQQQQDQLYNPYL